MDKKIPLSFNKEELMKKAVFAAFLLINWLSVFPVFAGEDNEKPLEGALRLSRSVKEFERTIGINPSAMFTKKSGEVPAFSYFGVWVQKLFTTPLDEEFFMEVTAAFAGEKNLNVKKVWVIGQGSRGYSFYYRTSAMVADPSSPVTADFAKRSVLDKVDAIIHEDLHLDNRRFFLSEDITTPLAHLAALKFFETAADAANAEAMRARIEKCRKISEELNAMVRELQIFYKKREEVLRLLDEQPGGHPGRIVLEKYPAYAKMFREQTAGQDEFLVFDAKISHDFKVFQNYNRVLNLYGRIGNLKTLILELKDKKLDALEKKYGLSARP